MDFLQRVQKRSPIQRSAARLAAGATSEGPAVFLFLFWWCVDDHLAAAMGMPGLGSLPIWVPLILSLAFSFTLQGAVKKTR